MTNRSEEVDLLMGGLDHPLKEEIERLTADCNGNEPVCKPSAVSLQLSANNKKLKADG